MFNRKSLFILFFVLLAGCGNDDGWRTARNDSSGIANPATTEEALVQVYGAPVYGWRGKFADHTWIAVKPSGTDSFMIYQVVGWRLRRGQSVVSISEGVPDRHWYGSEPTLYLDLRGSEATKLIQPITDAAEAYPHVDEYTLWPGPNSNSFVQWVALEVPELGLELSWRAWGKNWMKNNYDKSRRAMATGE